MAQQKSNGHASKLAGPWVNVATVCTAFVQDLIDGPTLRGMTSGVTIGVPEEARGVKQFDVASDVTLVLTLSGGAPGRRADIFIGPEGEDGQARPGQTVSLQFDTEGMLRQPFTIKVDFWGEQRYWFNVRLDGRLLTRVPLQVRYQFERR